MRLAAVAVALTLLALLDAIARAEEPPGVVLWLAPEGDPAGDVERALRLELASRGMVLLRSDDARAPSADAADDPAAARSALERTTADAVLWLRGDASQQVTWLRVLRRGQPHAQQAPLAQSSAALDPQLVAVAAASLLDQVLDAPPAPAPAATATPQAPATSARPAPSAKAAARASAADLDPTPPSLRSGSWPARGRPNAPETPAPRKRWFVQLGAALAFGHVGPDMNADRPPAEAERSPEEDGVAEDRASPDPGFVFMPALRLAGGYWFTPDLALAVLYQWHPGVHTDTVLDAHLLGLQGELLLLHDRARVSSLSLLAGATVGRTDTPVEHPGAEGSGPDARSGPLGLHGGLRLRLATGERLALFASPVLGGRFPDPQFTAELDLGLEL